MVIGKNAGGSMNTTHLRVAKPCGVENKCTIKGVARIWHGFGGVVVRYAFCGEIHGYRQAIRRECTIDMQ